MKRKQSVALVGGGPTGVGIGRELQDAGIDFQIYESEADFGGVWNSEASSGRTYPSLHLISPKFNTQVADFPMPADYPDYPSHELMLRYIRSYARAFGLYEKTKFGARVTRLEPTNGEWRVTTRSGEVETHPLVIVCNGLQRIPRFPQPAYEGVFTGEVLHSSQYKSAEQFRRKRVLVVGGGNSGCDIAVDAVHHGSAVYHSTRRGYYYQPKFVAGKPTPQWMMELGNKFQSKKETLEHIQQVFRLAGFDGTDYGLPAPDYPLDGAHPIMNSQVLYHIGHGDIRAVGDIAAFEGRQVRFVGGETAAFDIIVYATGYDRDISFLDKKLLEWKSGIPDLFLHSVPRNLDNLLFMGFINSAAGLGDGLKTQGKFVCSYAQAFFGQSAGLRAFLCAKQTDNPDIGQGYFVDSHRHLWEADLWKLLRQMRKYRDLLDGCSEQGAVCLDAGPVRRDEAPPVVVAPVDEKTLELDVIRIAAGALGLMEGEVDPVANLSMYGVDSIAITEVMARISRHFSISVAPTTFFEAKHFKDLANILRQRYAKAVAAHYSKVEPRSGNPATGAIATPAAVDTASWIARHRRARKKTSSAVVEAQRERQVPIAVIAMQGAFPQSPDLDALETHLRNGDDCIEEVPSSRWDWRAVFGDPRLGSFTNVKYGGFVSGHDEFDAAFFSISPREAELMDPQHRLFLECVWRLVESAGYAPSSLSGKKVGVFLGINLQDYADMVNRTATHDAVQLTGLGHMFCPNRLSFLLDIHGPSEVVDTACSSSLVAVHRAVMSILHEGCEMAIAGGANLMLTATQHILFSKVGMLAPDGRCKPFSKDANGYARAEGVGAVLLKRLDAAERDGDPILGVILGSAVNHGGAATSLTAPNPRAQAELIAEAYRRASVDPRTVGAIECHGTGTALGDPIEIEGLKAGFAALYKEHGFDGPPVPHCSLGSIKSNIGHAETAAGIAGLMKLLLGMRSGLLYRSLHCEDPNPLIELEGSPFRLQADTQPWKRAVADGREAPRTAGVSSFGAGGANAHVVLQEYIAERRHSSNNLALGPVVFPLSAKTGPALLAMAKRLSQWLKNPQNESFAIHEIAYTLQFGRDEHRVRLAVVAADRISLIRQLDQFVSGDSHLGSTGTVERRSSEHVTALDPRALPAAEIASRWLAGVPIDWEKAYLEDRPRRLALPGYSFSGKRFWIPGEISHRKPVPPVISSGPDRWVVKFQGSEPFLADHRVGLSKVLPGVMYLELVYATAREAALLPVSIRQSVWLTPLVVDRPIEVEISLTRLESMRHKVEVASVTEDKERVVHFQTRLLPVSAAEAVSQTRVEDLQAAHSRNLEGSDVYELFAALGIHYGPSHKTIRHLGVGGGTALAALELPGTTCALSDYVLHPSLLDGAFQAAIGMTLDVNGKTSNGLALPFSLESVDITGRLTEQMWACVKSGTKAQAVDIDLLDSTGGRAVRFTGFVTRSASSPGEHPVPLLSPGWQPATNLVDESAHRFRKCAIFAGFGERLPEEVAGRLPGWDCKALAGDGFLSCAVQLLGVVRDVASHMSSPILLQLIVPERGLGSPLTGLSGMLLSLGQEYPRIWPQMLTIRGTYTAERLSEYVQESAKMPGHGTFLFENAGRFVRSWNDSVDAKHTTDIPWRDDGVYLITGGMGALARLVASDIVGRRPGAVVVLSGRSRSTEEFETWRQSLTTSGQMIWYRQANIENGDEVNDLLAAIRARHGRITGVLHLAGKLDDCLLPNLDEERFRTILGPKILGVQHLDAAIGNTPLDFFVLFGSIAGALGNSGQIAYSTANSFLDSFAMHREEQRATGHRQGRTISIAWPFWSDGGMRMSDPSIDLSRKINGLAPLATNSGLTALHRAIQMGSPNLLVAPGNLEQIRRQLTRVRSVPDPATPVAVSFDRDLLSTRLSGLLSECVCQLLKLAPGDLTPETELNEYGFDSITFTQFANELNDRLNLSITPTLFFEYSTLESLSAGLIDTHGSELAGALQVGARLEKSDPVEQGPVAAPYVPVRLEASRGAIAIVGMSGAFPMAKDLDEFWKNLVEGKDCIREVPSERWDWKAYWGDPANEAGRTNVKWAGFVDEISEFDPAFFGISPPEARVMDPQQRLLLTHAWLAIENAGYAPKGLSGTDTGVFIGIADTGYSRLVTESEQPIEGYLMTGLAPSLGPNRISHFLNLHGPSVAVETACSSSLVAVGRAVEAIRSGSCSLALAGGVNTLLLPDSFVGFSRAGMLSADGHCRTFSDGANGYARGEGVGVVVLKPLADAERDGDRILGVIRSVAENHGGRAGALTAPNPRAQAELIRSAYRQAGFDPRTVSYFEAHGTGTPIGDPIEIEGIKNAFADLASEAERSYGTALSPSCAIGTVKASIGHLEIAAGIAGLIKVLLQMQHQTIVRVLHCERLNPYLKLDGTGFHIAQENESWRRPVGAAGQEVPRRAGISSFGFGGSNAHLVVEEYVAERRPIAQASENREAAIFVLSARTEEQLVNSARQLRDWLYGATSGIAPADVAFTLQVARDAMEHRLGFVASHLQDAAAKLTGFVDGRPDADIHVNSVKANRDMLALLERDQDVCRTIASMPLRGNTQGLLQLWVRGLTVDWRSLYAGSLPHRIALPGYPFARNRYWVGPARASNQSERIESWAYRRTVDGSEWFLRDHCIRGQVVVPGVVHLELVRDAVVSKMGWHGPIALRQHTWLKPIAIQEEPVCLSVEIRENDGSTVSYELRVGGTIHSTGIAAQAMATTPYVDMAEARREAPQRIDTEECYRFFCSLGIAYGPAHRTLRSLHRGERTVLAELFVPEAIPLDEFQVHPSLVDGALQATIGFALGGAAILALPYAIRQVEIFGPCSRHMWAIVKRDPGIADTFHVDLCSDQGEVRVRIAGFSIRQVQERRSSIQELVRIAAAVLEIESSAIETDVELGEFGFDSVTMTVFASKVNEELGLSLTPADFFEFATLDRLARSIDDRQESRVQTAPAIAPRSVNAQPDAEEPIVIVGMSCQFPMAADPSEFWNNLRNGRDCISEVPGNRWDWRTVYGDPKSEPGKTNNRWGGFIDGVFDFDPLFFGISPKEASWMDPQQRLLLTHVWKTLEDAGHAPREFGGQSIGIFVGTSMSGRGVTEELGGESYAATGAVPSVGPNRVSYFFDWHGPSEPIETACSSSLVAIHKAVQAIRAGDCEMAVAGGVNTIVTPEAHVLFSQAGMLSPDGRCKTFSASADGYVRGEGIGLFLLKKKSKAERDGNSIYAVIRGTAINHGGRANSLTAPNTAAQVELLRAAYGRAGVDPATVTYVEAHGTGTALGDPVEVNALKAVFNRSEQPFKCALGAVKTNIGHLELAAGAAGLAKVLLQIRHKTIAPSLHCEEVNPYIDLSGSQLSLVPACMPWGVIQDGSGKDLPRRAGISSFGFGGVNAHIVVEEYCGPDAVRRPDAAPVLIVLSAREEEKVREQAAGLADWIAEVSAADSDLEDISYTLLVGREPMRYRAGMVAASIGELVHLLRAYARGDRSAVAAGKVDRSSAAAVDLRGLPLKTLAERWVAGQPVVGSVAFHGPRRRLHLPTYPFSGRQEKQPAPTSSEIAGIVVDPAAYYLRDHLVHGRRVLPGAMGLELVRRAYGRKRPASESLGMSFQHVLLRQPLIVDRQAMPVDISIELESEPHRFRLATGNENTHIQGFLHSGGPQPSAIELEPIRQRCTRAFTATSFYELFTQAGIAYGPSFRPVKNAFAGNGEALGYLVFPNEGGEQSGMHPAMVDGAFQVSGLLLQGASAGTLVPFAIERVDVLGETTEEMWAYAWESASTPAVRKLDIDLADTRGVVRVRIRGLSLRVLVTPSKQDVNTPGEMQSYLTALVAAESGVAAGSVVADEPLEAYGLDSMMIGRLTDRLEQRFGPLPKTLFFEYQTIEQLAAYFTSRTDAVPVERPVVHERDSSIAIVGLAGRYPGARNLTEFWDNLANGRDSITEVPASRWDHSQYYDTDRRVGKTNSKWGGFLDDADCFDPLFFHISPREAEFLDPQERVFLQCAWEAIEDAGYTRANLAPAASPMKGGNVGVFVGVMYEDYQLWGPEMTAAGQPTVLSGSAASIANRVSYFCDFHGPSLTVDTMCSSSLTAIHLACESLRAGSCAVALAGGVNLTLHPNKYVCLTQGRFTSSTGRCESYGRGGDGYVPGEGVGAVILKPLVRALADGDQIYGVIRATALNHGGKTNGYTVPNPHAQTAVIADALTRGGVNPREISYVEGHGTGTSLGDPIEIAALSTAFRPYTKDAGFCAIGSVKSNIGHCESAAGIAGLTKVLLQLKHGQIAPSLHAETLNPGIDFGNSPFTVQRTLADWPRPAGGRRVAGLSAFGAGGSNVHLIVEEHQANSVSLAEPIRETLVFPFSAHDHERLQELLGRYVERLPQLTDADLPSVAFVLQHGRESFPCRVVIEASSVQQLITRIRATLAGKSISLGESALASQAKRWVSGQKPEWVRAAGPAGPVRRVSLPLYPFARERFWAPLPVAVSRESREDRVPLIFSPQWEPTAPGAIAASPAKAMVVLCNLSERATIPNAEIVAVNEPRYMEAAARILGLLQRFVDAGGGSLFQVVISTAGELSLLRGLIGMLRTAQWEHPKMRFQLIEVAEPVAGLAQILRREQLSGDVHVRYSRQERLAHRWKEVLPRTKRTPWKDAGVYLITGGAGGLGLLLAEEIARSVAAPVIWLTSRSPMPLGATDTAIRLGAKVFHRRTDVSHLGEVEALIQEMLAAHERIDGIIHCAGVLRDKLLVRKTEAEFQEVLSPKVRGAINLDAATAGISLDFMLLFASVSGALGNSGQVDYAAANAFLDAFAERRNEQVGRGLRHGRTVSLDWPYWRDGGMRLNDAVIDGMRRQFGVAPLETSVAMVAVKMALDSGESQVVILDGDHDRLRREMGGGTPEESRTASGGPRAGVFRDRIIASFQRHLSATLQVPVEKLDPGEPLERYGLDSVSAVEVCEAVGREVGVLLAPTLLLEYPKISMLADHLVEQHDDIELGPQAPVHQAVSGNSDIAVISVVGRYPGADNLDEFWEVLQEGRDCITEVPRDRWNAELHFSPEKGKPGASYCKWGGFVAGADCFDAGFFAVSNRDAALMDPQERIFLESVWHLFERAGYTRAHLHDYFDSRVGVYVGAMSHQYHSVDGTPDQKALVAMSSYASIANRVSYFFDLRGPSIALDTMCSGGLHAVHLACRALQAGDCRIAVAGGVNLSIHPNKYLALSRSGLLGSSPDSRGFANGDGYLPSEGVGAVLLKPVADAKRDGDSIIAIIRGSTANHGGHSAGFMVPSAEGQADLIEENLRTSGVDPRSIGYVEAAVNGSALADSIEVRALTKAFRRFTPDREFCAIGSVKSNMGHAEAASGMAQLTKVLLQCFHKKLVPTLRPSHPNPHIHLEGSPFFLQTSLAEWQSPTVRRAAISSFGAGGSNVHLVVEEAPVHPIEVQSDEGAPWVFLFSANTTEQLKDWMALMQDYIAKRPDLSLSQLSYTLCHRRERLACMQSIRASSRSELLTAMADCDGGGECEVGQPDRAPRGQVLPLPGYPFARTRHWLSPVEPVAAITNPPPIVRSALDQILHLVSDELAIPLNAVEPEQLFIPLGIDSMAGMRLVQGIREKLQQSISHSDLLRFPTPALLAQYLDRRSSDGAKGKEHAAAVEVPPFPCPLSEGQRALWVHQKLFPESTAYNVPLAYKVVDFRIDAGALACEWLLQTFPILRAVVSDEYDRPALSLRSGPPELLRTVPVPPGVDVVQFAKHRAAQPFDLASGAPIRFELLTADHSVLLITVHHIVIDGFSAVQLAGAFWQAYDAYAAGKSPELCVDAAPFSHFVAWEQQYLESDKGRADGIWWRHELEHELPSLDLVLDGPSGACADTRFECQEVDISDELSSRIRIAAQNMAVTHANFFLGAFAILLSRYTGEEQFIIGMPVAGRPERRFRRTFGYLANMLPLRVELEGRQPLNKFFASLQSRVTEALDHSLYPLARLLRDLRPDSLTEPLFHATFSYQSFLEDPGGAGGLSSGGHATHIAQIRQIGDTPLGLEIGAWDGKTRLAITYDASLYSAAGIASFLSHCITLLSSIVGDMTCPMGRVELLEREERARITGKWSRSAVAHAGRGCVHQWVDRIAERSPGSIAIVAGENQLSYGELRKRANRLANYLKKRGAGVGTVIASCLPRTADSIVALLAIWKTGGVWVPLDAAWPGERLAYVIRDAGAGIVLADNATEGTVVGLIPKGVRAISLDRVGGTVARSSSKIAVTRISGDRPAYVIYTSGSTGKPKGVIVGHRALAAHCRAARDAYGVTNSDTVLQFSAHSVDPALEQILIALTTGARLVVRPVDVWTSRELREVLESNRVTVADLPPAYIREVLRDWAEPGAVTIAHVLRLLILGGDVLSRDIVELWKRSPLANVRLINAYGPTESVITATIHPVVADDAQRTIPIGRPLGPREVYILDRYGNPVPEGVPGDLHIAGLCLATGYCGDSAMTASRFVPNPFSGGLMYRTGDRASFVPGGDGAIAFHGRGDHQVKIRGFRVEPEEVETHLRTFGCRDVVVLLHEDGVGGQSLYAVVVAPQFDENAARHFLARHLPAHMLPVQYCPVSQIPMTAGGKVDRHALRAICDRPSVRPGSGSPRNEIEERLAKLWCESLGRDSVSAQDDFFALGGHSLLCVRLLSSIQREFGRELSIASLLRATTLAQQAQLLGAVPVRESTTSLVELSLSRGGLPVFMIHPVGGGIGCYWNLARQACLARTVYGIQSPMLDSCAAPSSMEELAAQYISIIRRVQPIGPYSLVGWSIGGVLAFEMARQLALHGERIDVLLVIDSYLPEDLAQLLPSSPSEEDELLAFAADLLGSAGGQSRSAAALQDVSVAGVARLCGIELAQCRSLFDVFRVHGRISRAYVPQQADVPLVLVRGTQTPIDITRSWQQLVSTDIKQHGIDADHYGILNPENAPAIAQILAEAACSPTRALSQLLSLPLQPAVGMD